VSRKAEKQIALPEIPRMNNTANERRYDFQRSRPLERSRGVRQPRQPACIDSILLRSCRAYRVASTGSRRVASSREASCKKVDYKRYTPAPARDNLAGKHQQSSEPVARQLLRGSVTPCCVRSRISKPPMRPALAQFSHRSSPP